MLTQTSRLKLVLAKKDMIEECAHVAVLRRIHGTSDITVLRELDRVRALGLLHLADTKGEADMCFDFDVPRVNRLVRTK